MGIIINTEKIKYMFAGHTNSMLPPEIPYILESNPHPFYSFRGLKNQMRIRFAVYSWILEK
jgi:hypothetical protein